MIWNDQDKKGEASLGDGLAVALDSLEGKA